MRIGIISDTHSNFSAIRKACEIFRENNVNTILHCGDITSSEALKSFNKFEVYFVFGNIDVNRNELERTSNELGFHCLKEEGAIFLGKKRIALIHGDNKKRLLELIEQQEFDIVLTGHTHKKEAYLFGKTLVINPGAHNPINTLKENRTLALLDLEKPLVPEDVGFISLV